MLPKRIIAVGVGAVVVAGGVTVGGVAAADSSTSSTHSTSTTTSTTGTATASSRHHRRPLARRALHGEFVVRGKGGKDLTVDMVRGKVTAVSPTSITVAARDGYSATYAVTSKTRVHVRGQKGKQSITVVKTGDRAGVFATKAGTALDARAVVDRGQK